MRTFRRVLPALAIVGALFLSACGTTGTVTPQGVVDWVKANCGFIVDVAEISTLITKDPAGMALAAIGKQICDAIQAQSPTAQPGTSGGVVVINGVPIHYTVK